MEKILNKNPKRDRRESCYTAPAIEVIDIEITQNILGESTGAKSPDGIPGDGFW